MILFELDGEIIDSREELLNEIGSDMEKVEMMYLNENESIDHIFTANFDGLLDDIDAFWYEDYPVHFIITNFLIMKQKYDDASKLLIKTFECLHEKQNKFTYEVHDDDFKHEYVTSTLEVALKK